ncbi:MAG: hypothetical protein JWQ22_1872 [Devosia sp.]|nr:hypothetical protein [Devosia sp.]
METSGPSFWLILLTLGVILLAVAIAYATMRNQKRTPVEKATTAAATRREYDKEDRDAS